MKISFIIGILTFITVNLFAVNQKQQYEVICGAWSAPIVESEWSVKGVVKNTSGGTTLTLTSFVDKKFYLQYVAAADKLYLVFDLSQYPSEIIVNYPIEVELTWTDPATGTSYSAKNSYVAGNKSTQNSNIFWVKDAQGLELKAPDPTMTVDNVTLCDGATGTTKATLKNAPAGYTIDWGDSHITTSGTPTATQANAAVAAGLAVGTHSLTAKLMDGATAVATANYTVKVNPIPTVNITTTPANGQVCLGSSLKVTANPSTTTGVSYEWTYTGTGVKNIKELSWSAVSASTPTSFSVIVTVAGCKSEPASTTVTINPLPTVTLTADADSKCAGEKVKLTATPTGGTPNYTYTWNPNTLSGDSPEPTLAKGNNTYKVSVTDNNGCKSAEVSKTVTGYSVTTTLAANPTSVSNGGSSVLTAGASGGKTPYTYEWDEFASNSTNTATASGLTATTTYHVIATDAEGCKSEAKATATVTVTGGALAIAPKDKEICSADLTTTLDPDVRGGSGKYSFTWTAPAGVQLSSTTDKTPTVLKTSTPGDYDITVEVRDMDTGVTKTGTLHLKIKESPVLTNIKADPASVTMGGVSQLSVSVTPGSSELTWSGGPLAATTGTNVATSSLSSSATYKVTAQNDGCSAELTVSVSVSGSSLVVTPPANTPMGGPDTDIPVCVTVSGGNCDGKYEYNWTTAAAGVTVTPGVGACATVRSTTLGVKEICVEVTCGIETQKKCFDVMIADPNALTLNWTISEMVCQYPGETRKINIMAVGAPDGAKYSFALSAPDGSSALIVDRDTKTSWEYEVTADRKGTYQLSKFSVLLPDGTTMDGIISPGQNIDADFYKVPAVYANGVVANSTLEHCEGEELILTGSGDAVDYVWDNGVQNGQPFIPTVAGTYQVTGTNEHGCVGTDQVTVNLNPKPELSISVSGGEICPGEEVTLSATTDLGTVAWNNGVTDGTPMKIDVSGVHKFTATATDPETGCTVSKDTVVLVKEKPTIVYHSKNPRNIAIGKDVYFAVKAAGTGPLSYEWYRKVGDDWSLLDDNSVSLPTVSGATTDSLVLKTVPESWDGSELKVVVKNECDTASMIFQLGVKECFEVEITMLMQEGIIPDTDPTNKIDGWYCRGRRIALRAILSSPEGYDIENAHYRWTIDGLELPEEHFELETDTCVLTWIPEFQEDDIVVKVCGYSDGACEEVCVQYVRLKAREFEKVSLELLTSVDPEHIFCPGDTVDFWVTAKNVGDSAHYEWYNDIFHLPEENPRNVLLSYAETKLTLVMGQEDTWMKVFVTPSQEVCTEEPVYMDTVFLRKGQWVTPSLRIINNIEDTMACRGDRILFTAVYENAGANPTFSWRKDVWDWGHEQFAEATLDDKDMWLKCWMVPGKDVCYDGSLLVDSMVIRILENPTVVISADLINKAPGDEIIIESEVTNMPTNAHYTWYLNYDYTLSNSDYPEYISDKLTQGDVIQCGVTGERICTSEVMSNELVIYFGDRSRDTMITIYQGEKIHNLNMRRRGDTENRIFRITADGYPRWGIGSMNFNGYFDYIPNAGFVGSDVVKYEVVDKFDQTKVETGYIYISVLDRKRFFIPNIITPNGDGVNDTWNLEFLADYPDHHITIYNRDGVVVFEATNYQNDWDGTGTTTSGYVAHFNLANGVYTYVIDLGNKEILKNWIEIRRDMNRGKYKY